MIIGERPAPALTAFDCACGDACDPRRGRCATCERAYALATHPDAPEIMRRAVALLRTGTIHHTETRP